MEERDIYFTEEYGKIYELNGEGKLETFQLESQNGEVTYRFLKREIPIVLDKKYYDIITPYGYGGPLFSNVKNLEELKKEFPNKFSKYCEENSIVSEFVRFHPIVKNHEIVQDFMEVIYNRDTICIDITSEKEIWDTFTSNCRKNTRKAIKNGVEIKTLENSRESLEEFYEIYIETMKQNSANQYYFFTIEFFMNTMKLLNENMKIFAAFHNGKIISSALIIHNGEYMSYHFSGSDLEARDIAANNLLIYEACKWGALNGKKYFQLGGGYLGNEDSLFRFKSSFSKKEPLKFYVGKKIYDEKVYGQLVEEVEKSKKIENINYFPLYRG